MTTNWYKSSSIFYFKICEDNVEKFWRLRKQVIRQHSHNNNNEKNQENQQKQHWMKPCIHINHTLNLCLTVQCKQDSAPRGLNFMIQELNWYISNPKSEGDCKALTHHTWQQQVSLADLCVLRSAQGIDLRSGSYHQGWTRMLDNSTSKWKHYKDRSWGCWEKRAALFLPLTLPWILWRSVHLLWLK